MVPSAVVSQAPSTADSAVADTASGSAVADTAPTTDAGTRWTPRALIGLVPAVLLLVVALWEIVAAARAGHDIPDTDDWQPAVQAVRARYQPGDLIVFAPAWLDPVGRMHLGDLISVDMATRMDDARYAIVWELSIDGAQSPESRDRQVAWSTTDSGIHVRKLVRTPAEVVTDFAAQFQQSRRRVKIEGRGVGSPRSVIEEVGFEPHRCIRVEPRPDQTVRITFDNVRLGSRLVGYVGLADVFTRRDIRDPGRLQVYVQDQLVSTTEFGVDDGWVRFSATTEPSEAARVTFAATAVGPKAKKRLICFAAEART